MPTSVTDQQRAMIELAAKAAAREATKETLLGLGIDTEDALSLQKDFAHLRQWRTNSEKIGGWTVAAVISAAGAGIVTILAAGYNALIGGHHP